MILSLKLLGFVHLKERTWLDEIKLKKMVSLFGYCFRGKMCKNMKLVGNKGEVG